MATKQQKKDALYYVRSGQAWLLKAEYESSEVRQKELVERANQLFDKAGRVLGIIPGTLRTKK